jgi:methionyl-tRNA formyltransferase
MRVEQGLDTGPVYASARTPIGASTTAGELRDELVNLGAQLLVDNLPLIAATTPAEQRGEATYAEKLAVEEFALDPRRPARELDRVVRAGNPRPGAWFVANGHRCKVWRTHVDEGHATAPGVLDDVGLGTVDGTLVLDEVQPEGKRRMSYGDWRRGMRGDLMVETP